MVDRFGGSSSADRYARQRASLRPETHPVTRQIIGTLNSINSKFVKLLKIAVLLGQLYCVTTLD